MHICICFLGCRSVCKEVYAFLYVQQMLAETLEKKIYIRL